MHRYIFVSAYLTRQEALLAYFERLDAHLTPLGFRLFLVNTGNAPIQSSIENVTLPAYVTLAQALPGGLFVGRNDLNTAQREAAGAEACRRGLSESTSALKVLLYVEAMREVMARIQPALVLLWLEFDGVHIALADLCRRLGVPHLFAEYGSLPGTIVFEREGQMAESWVARESERFLGLPVSEEELERAMEFLERVRIERQTRRAPGDKNLVPAYLARERAAGRKIVFYAGQNDPMTGMLPRWLPNARLHSPYFETTLDALNTLVQLAEERDWHILFKPHPMMERAHAKVAVPFPERCSIISGANIFNAIAHSDVTVTILSQVSYLALIHRKPCVLLGRNQLSGKSCVYEPDGRDGIADCIDRACSDGFTEVQQAAFVRHAAQMCKYNLFSFSPAYNGLAGRGESEAAVFVASHADNRVEQPGDGGEKHSMAFTLLHRILHFADPALSWAVAALETPLKTWYRGRG